MGLPPADGLNLIPISMPTRDIVEIDTDVALQLALTNHPNLVRQSLNIVIREKELFVAQNGLLPQLDFESLYRLNGLGENLGDALEQMATAAYSDWQLGASFSVPLGRRQAFANVRTAEMKVSRERVLFEQETLTRHDLGDVLRKIRLDHEQYREANLRLQAAEKWLQGGADPLSEPAAQRRPSEPAAAVHQRLPGRHAIPHQRCDGGGSVVGKVQRGPGGTRESPGNDSRPIRRRVDLRSVPPIEDAGKSSFPSAAIAARSAATGPAARLSRAAASWQERGGSHGRENHSLASGPVITEKRPRRVFFMARMVNNRGTAVHGDGVKTCRPNRSAAVAAATGCVSR